MIPKQKPNDTMMIPKWYLKETFKQYPNETLTTPNDTVTASYRTYNDNSLG